ncbi:MAG: MBL fold metallo-hydrolase [Acidobacteriota bacterium]|jgi:phosphoribosyl 1,2-cyclic phosphate phosphodiesterase
MRVTFLGTGTSVGVPVITCGCEVCTSDDPRNNRLRAGLLLDWHDDGEAVRVLVDTTTDLRQQALRVGLDRVDAVIYTHHHADHVLGLDELRIFNFVHRMQIPLYGRLETIDGIRKMFSYAFHGSGRGVPRLELIAAEEPFGVHGVRIAPVPVRHDRLTISAYRIGNFAYITDCSGIPESSLHLLDGVEVMVIDALRRQPHPAHFTLDQALAEIERIGAPLAYLTHLSHEFDHATLEEEVPDGVHVAYDGLVLEIDEVA